MSGKETPTGKHANNTTSRCVLSVEVKSNCQHNIGAEFEIFDKIERII
jgi:hypothetical protein